ncbi:MULTISPECIES: type II secretion system F family protein [unclassified Bradyrhizobium]|uniref:type II secretion system F family protein n=1 Tax=unclassified Bradyrhizobium TaxID=2631580 RepID=UPI0028EFC4F4|nr:MULTISPECIES: type II secretion system F family protein [unclassified Bradyrhizobium]
MNAWQLWNALTFADLMGLFGIIALVAGGTVLIASSILVHADALARRVNLALPRPAMAGAGAPGEAHPTIVQQLPSLAVGISKAEQQQIIRLLSYLRVPADRAVSYFVVARVVVALSFAALALGAAMRFALFAAHWWLPIMAAIVAAIVGWISPLFYIDRVVKQQAEAVASGLPDALELLVVCVEAGLSLEDGLQRVARELREAQPALADELVLTWAEINVLPSRAQALANLADRIDVPSVRSVVSMLSQSLQFGTPLAQSLRVGAVEMRNDQMALLEERASRLPAMLTIPVMLFIMPTVFLLVGGPAALRLIDMFRSGLH